MRIIPTRLSENGLIMHNNKVKKILLVDDESDICITLASILGDNGFAVDTFDDPLLVLENFRKDFFDLLILDIKMEKMNGLELYKEIKKIDNKVKICFLTTSKFNYQAFIDVLSDLNENEIIQKPIENKELIKIINEMVN